MKKILITLALLVTGASAQLVPVYKEKSGIEHFVEQKSIMLDRGKALFMGVSKMPEGLMLTGVATDCKKEYVILITKLRTPELSVTYEFHNPKPQTIISGSRMEPLINYACNEAGKKELKKDLFI